MYVPVFPMFVCLMHVLLFLARCPHSFANLPPDHLPSVPPSPILLETAISHHPESAPSIDSSPPPTPPKVILIYALENCNSSIPKRPRGNHYGLEANADLRFTNAKQRDFFNKTSEALNLTTFPGRVAALTELERRFNRTLSILFGASRYPKRSLAEDENADSPIDPKFQIKFQYLSALHMEIAEFPDFIDPNQALKMTEDLPCVKLTSEDYIISREENEPLSNRVDEASNTTKRRESKDAPAFLQGFLNLQSWPHSDQAPEATEVFNDPLASKQWYLKSSLGGIQFDAMWTKYHPLQPLEHQIIAIIDDGCDSMHEELADRIWTNPREICNDGIDNDGNGYVDDCHGWDWVEGKNSVSSQLTHGTAVTGIIGSKTNNHKGIVGICWTCQIMCLRYIGPNGGSVSHQVAALDYAIRMGSRISNNSFGSYRPSALEKESIYRSSLHGHLLVTSSGNNNYSTDNVEYLHCPSAYNLNNILAVGASTPASTKASFSNYGKVTVDVFAPGTDLYTLNINNGYKVVNGTSYSTAIVTGIVGLILSYFPSLTYLEVVHILINTCTPSSHLQHYAQCGGIIDAKKAMDTAALMHQKKTYHPVAYPATPTHQPSTPTHPPSTPTYQPSTSVYVYDPNSRMGFFNSFLSGINRAFTHSV